MSHLFTEKKKEKKKGSKCESLTGDGDHNTYIGIKSYLFPVAKLVKVEPNILAMLMNCLCGMTVYFTYITLICEEDKNKQKTEEEEKGAFPQSGHPTS